MSKNPIRIIALAMAAALAIGALSGCASMGQTSEEAKAQAENRQFMSDVNATMGQLAERLEAFNDAVSSGDAVAMRTQADNAFEVLADLEAIEAPEVLADTKQGYVDGCNQLKDALNAYIALYAGIQNGSADYDAQLSAVQDSYNQAVDKLKATDEAAAAL